MHGFPPGRDPGRGAGRCGAGRCGAGRCSMTVMPDIEMPTGAARTSPATRISRCELEAGRLQVTYRDERPGEPAPFDFAERDNPRRAFLFVSRVLGRHVPVRPARMRAAFTRLADAVPAELPGPVLVTGMAETAVGLGAGVHDAYLARTGRTDVLYLATSRARLAEPPFATFVEAHSHASAHRVHHPQHASDRARLAATRSLVMVDDEASSGATFRNLARALVTAGLDALEHVHTAVLTDWSEAEGSALVPAADGRRPVVHSRSALLRGRYDWQPRPDAPRRTLPDADTPREATAGVIPRADDGRLGRAARSTTRCPAALRAALRGVTGTVSVIGTGEHVWEPFLIADALERDGHDVRFSATTRSPILPGHAVRRGYAFADHEGLGITNYLYNVDPSASERVVLCVDTALDAVDPGLIAALDADVLVGETWHARRTLEGRVRGAPPARTFVATDTVR